MFVQNISMQISFFLVLTSRTCFKFNDFQICINTKKNEDDLSSTIYLPSSTYINTCGAKPNELGFVISNDKASYVAKGDSICLFSVATQTNKRTTNKTLCPFVVFNLLHVGEKYQNGYDAKKW